MGKTLVICEKPDQARKYAAAMSVYGKFNKNNGYLESDKYIFTNAFGHLVTSKGPRDYEEFTSQPNKGWHWSAIPFFPPNGSLDYVIEDKGKVAQMKIIGELLKRDDVDMVVNGADAGREGDLIFWEVYDYFKCKKPVKRLWCSTYVEEDVQNAFQSLLEPAFFLPRRDSAYSRQFADWALGMNLTVGFTIKANMGRTLHIGRVQTPTIALLVQRKQEIENFVPEEYFELEAEFGGKYKGKWFKEQLGNTKFDKKEDGQAIADKIQGKIGTVIKKEVKPAPEHAKKLYNLNDLQREASKKFGFDPTKTLNIAQLLYEKYAVLSYPRTDSRFLAEVHVSELPSILKAVSIPEYQKFTSEIVSKGIPTSKAFINDKEVTDHHAIIPTKKQANPQAFDDDMKQGIKADDLRKVYDMVVKRFLAVFYPPAMYEKTEIVTEVEQETFKTSGKILVDPGWKEIYGADIEEDDDDDETPKKGKKQEEKVKVVKLPPIEQGETNPLTDIDFQSKFTKPPAHYTYDALLGVMESPGKFLEDDELKEVMKEKKAGLGTGATRAGIIDNVISRGYVEKKGKTLIATELAEKVIAIAPEGLTSPIVTAEWEQKLNDMEHSKIQRTQFEQEIRQYVGKNLETLRDAKLEVTFTNVNNGSPIGANCPKCGKDVIEKKSVYCCQSHTQETPCFVVFKTVGENKKKVSEAQVKQIATKGVTSSAIKGIKGKSGKTFDAKIKWNPETGRTEYLFDQPESTNLTCPFCGKGEVRENAKAFGCTNWKDGCKFTVWKTTLGKTMTLAIVKELVSMKQTKLMKGFKKKDGTEMSEARLVLNLEKKSVDLAFK